MTRLNSGVIILVVAGLLLAVPTTVAFAQRPNETTTAGGGPGGGGGAGTAGGGGAMSGGGSSMGSGGSMGSSGSSSGSASGGSSWGGGTSGTAGSSDGSSGYRGDNRGGAAARNPRANETTALPASPWYSRPRGENPVTGTATIRTTPIPGTGGTSNGVDYTPYGSIYGNSTGCFGYGCYGNYGWGYQPFGWGGFGFGSYYYDPFWSGYGGYPGYGYGYGSEYGGGYGWSTPSGYAPQQRPTGSVRLKVKPANATVYVDGYYTGRVDDFDGLFQRLRLEPGPHKIEISAQGFKSISFEVNIGVGQNINFQGELEIIK